MCLYIHAAAAAKWLPWGPTAGESIMTQAQEHTLFNRIRGQARAQTFPHHCQELFGGPDAHSVECHPA